MGNGKKEEAKKLICVTSQGDNLDSDVDSRFGRCQYFIIVDTESMSFEALKNPNISGMGGVGVQSAQLIADRGVQAVLTGNVGPNAFQTLQAAGIEIVTGVEGVVREAVERYKEGGFKSTSAPTVEHKSGMSNENSS